MGGNEGFRGPKQWQGLDGLNRQALRDNKLPRDSRKGDILGAVQQNHQLLGDHSDHVFERVRAASKNWIERKFSEYRAELNDWSIDAFLVDSSGNLYGDTTPWSTFRDAEQGVAPHPTLDELILQSTLSDGWVIPITPIEDTALFWLGQHSDAVINTIYKGKKVKTSVFDHGDSNAEGFRDMVMTARTVANLTEPAVFGERGVTVGRLGFWDKPSHPQRYIPRVYVSPRSESLGSGTIVVSSLSEEEIERNSLTPMDRKHPGVRVVRTQETAGFDGFITAALQTFSAHFADQPFVLRYTTPRAWDGEGPKPHESGMTQST